jgi:hypothetical protein
MDSGVPEMRRMPECIYLGIEIEPRRAAFALKTGNQVLPGKMKTIVISIWGMYTL